MSEILHTSVRGRLLNTSIRYVYTYLAHIFNIFDLFKNVFYHRVYLKVCTVPEFLRGW